MDIEKILETIPEYIKLKWQEVANLLAELVNIPVALIMISDLEYMQVLISSQTENNPYKAGDKEKWHGLYCQTVIKSQNELLVPNALKDPLWDKNPDIKLGMVAYLGYPINFPNGEQLGTICVLDTKENPFSELKKNTILKFRKIIEDDLIFLSNFEKIKSEISDNIGQIEEIKNKNKSNQNLLFTIAENYPHSYISIIEKDLTIGFTAGQEFKNQNIDPNQFIGLSLDDVFHDKAPFVKENYLKTFKGEETVFELFINNQHQLYKTIPLRNEKNKITRIMCVVENITQRKQNEVELEKRHKEIQQNKKLQEEINIQLKNKTIELEKSNKQLEFAIKKAEEDEQRLLALQKASFGGIFFHENGFILDCNKTLSEITGYSYDELIGMDCNLLFTKKHKGIANYREKNKDELSEIEGVRKNGEIYYIKIETCKIPFNSKMVNSVEIRDITDYITTQKELIKAKNKAEESDRLKTQFFNNMSHEIRTPMNGILGFAELLNKPDLTDEKRGYFINIIQNSGAQLLKIIDDILEISQLETKQIQVKPTEVCLNDLFLELFSIFDIKAKENKTPLYLKKNLSDKESTISTDPAKLHKIISNLLENALKFTNKGHIEFGYNFIKTEHVPYIEIFVKDTGIGISKEKFNVIFERFSQEEIEISQKAGGLGLGLSIAKENTELLDGMISLESEKGIGTTFYVKIPYRSNYQNKISDSLKKTFNILIAEDEEINYLYIETILNGIKEFDIKTYHAFDGEHALKLVNDQIDFNLILMDLKMPVINGYKASEIIREKNKNIPIIAITAYTSKEDEIKAIRSGCNDFITKPISEEKLSKAIKKYLSLQ